MVVGATSSTPWLLSSHSCPWPVPTSLVGRIDITGGWRKFVNSAGLRLGDTIKLQHLPGSVLLVTVLGRAACGQQASAGRAAPACAERGAKTSKRAGSVSQHEPLRRQGKHVCDVSPDVQEGGGSAEASDADGLQPTTQWQVHQRDSQQAQQQEQQEQQPADGPPGLQQDEPPYVRHTPSTSGDEQRQQQEQRRQGEELLGPQPMFTEEDEVAALTKQTVAAVAALCGGGSGNVQDDGEGSAAARPAKRRRATPSGLAAAAAAVAPSVTPSPELQSGADAAEQEEDEVAAAAAELVGRHVVLVSMCAVRPFLLSAIVRFPAGKLCVALPAHLSAFPPISQGFPLRASLPARAEACQLPSSLGTITGGRALDPTAPLFAFLQRNPPGTKLRWTLGQVLGTLPNQPGGLKLGPLPPLAGAQQAPPLPPPQAHVSEVAAVLPEDLVGWTVLKVNAVGGSATRVGAQHVPPPTLW